MSRWFRFYDDTINDPKILRLSDAEFRSWVTLLCIASKNNGALPSAKDIGLVLRMKPAKVAAWFTTLTAHGLLDCRADGTFAPHNWEGRQFKSDASNDRVQRYRTRKRNGECNVTSTVTVTPPEQKQIQKDAADAASVDQEVDLFRRGKQVLGQNAGGLISQLLKAKGGKVTDARAAIETAAGKQNPREYVNGVIRKKNQDDGPQWLDGIPGVL